MTEEWGQRNNAPILRPGWGLGLNRPSFWQKDGVRKILQTLTDLPFLPERNFAGSVGAHLGGETRPRRGWVRRRLTGFFRDNFGAGSGGNTPRISCWAAT